MADICCNQSKMSRLFVLTIACMAVVLCIGLVTRCIGLGTTCIGLGTTCIGLGITRIGLRTTCIGLGTTWDPMHYAGSRIPLSQHCHVTLHCRCLPYVSKSNAAAIEVIQHSHHQLCQTNSLQVAGEQSMQMALMHCCCCHRCRHTDALSTHNTDQDNTALLAAKTLHQLCCACFDGLDEQKQKKRKGSFAAGPSGNTAGQKLLQHGCCNRHTDALGTLHQLPIKALLAARTLEQLWCMPRWPDRSEATEQKCFFCSRGSWEHSMHEGFAALLLRQINRRTWHTRLTTPKGFAGSKDSGAAVVYAQMA